MRSFTEVLESRRLYAATLPSGFTETILPGGTVASPTSLTELPDGRLLATQKNGQLRVFKNGALLATPAMTLPVDTSGERGLLTVEADPKFDTNHYIYAYYFRPSKGFGQISRFTMSGDTVVAGSELTLLQLSKATDTQSHAGGTMHFGKDGKLYLAVGDNEVGANSQSLATTNGKLLRINSNGSIPSDNPYYSTLAGPLRSIYATGLRNPFTGASDPVSGAFYINDVGDKKFEEVDVVRKGANFGWPDSEGPTNNPAYDSPLYSYNVAAAESISGGSFYSGVTQQFPASYAGKYFFGDFVQGFVKTLDPATKQASDFATGIGSVIDIDVARDGTLLVTTYDGHVHAIKYQKPTEPPAGNASFAGYVINDVNRNGKWDSGEKGIAGRTVWIDLDNDGFLDRGERTALTEANGRFFFDDLAPGTYKFREIIPSGSAQTSPTMNYGLSVTLVARQAKSGMSFQVTTV